MAASAVSILDSASILGSSEASKAQPSEGYQIVPVVVIKITPRHDRGHGDM